MSGIAGFIKPINKEEVDFSKVIKEMVQQLHHRGPDGNFYKIDKQEGWAFGQAYLDIEHLGDQAKPVKSDEICVLQANGRFYNDEAFEMMGNGGDNHDFLLSIFKEKSLSEAINYLRGEFSISYYQRNKKTLYLIRDRFGVKPMFYHLKNNSVYFSSEVKGILSQETVKATLSSEAILHQLMQTMIPGQTSFEQIHAVKPGHYLEVKWNEEGIMNVTEIPYWDFNFPKAAERKVEEDPQYYIDNVREKLEEAVKVRMHDNVKMGSYLSGGIDSCCILGLASKHRDTPLQAFTISFDHSAYDESSIATEMAEMVSAPQKILKLAAENLYGKDYIETIWHAERGFYNTLGVAKKLMSETVKSMDYEVVLTGEGSDELFGGYPSFKRDFLKAENRTSKKKATNSIFTGAILSEEEVSHPAWESLMGFTPSWMQPWMQTLELARPLLHDRHLDALKNYDPIEAIVESINPEMIEARHPLDQAQYTWSKTMLECQILNWGGDRVDMANGMEARPPFLDHHLAAFAVQIPPELRIKDETEKWVLKEAVRDVVPNTLYEREKFAFMAPPAHTDEKKKAAIQELFDTYLSEEAIKKAGIFDLKRMQNFITAYKEETDSVALVRKDALINHILGLQILSDLFVKN